ncbi:MAG: ATP-dependent RNA helicase HrpA [Magnetococcus sp. WYHC-3]
MDFNTLRQWQRELDRCLIADREPLTRRLELIQRRLRRNQPVDQLLQQLLPQLEAARDEAAWRREHRPQPRYPQSLPVVMAREEIAQTIAAHPVVVLCGETGSGKTTQLPKILLESGLADRGWIGLTQPRRIAALGIADHLARELESEVGAAVGAKIRFHEMLSPRSFIKVMTDGILLAEIQSDPELRQYQSLIIDEAHERSLNIDFLLGYLKQLLPRRPDLKLVISSATLDTDKFSRHFHDAPVLEISGRTYPVDLHYRPLHTAEGDGEEQDLTAGILAAVDELCALGPEGDVLVFLPGEREIRDNAEALRKHHPPATEILPLYARLSRSEQERIFHPQGRRRIILATNVAETSLTVPNVRYVVDTGLARISRYSTRTQVQRLPVEPISQASAKQRTGRCGRLTDGVCLRLYSQEDFLQRPVHTDPEILRTSLAAVILRMKDLRMGKVEDFPFIDPPGPKAIRDGYQALREIDALDDQGELTATGQQLARLPLDPRLGRMLLAAQGYGALSEMLVIVSALSCQDPRERPAEQAAAAQCAHARFVDQRSDFEGLLTLWRFIETQHAQARSKSRLRAWLKENFLSPTRVREWEDVHGQLSRTVKELGMRPNEIPAGTAELHKALLTGLAAGVGFKSEGHAFTGVRELRFHIHPASGLFKSPPKWVMAAELVETTRLFARLVAKIQPEWVEESLGHLLKRHWFEPWWDDHRGMVMAFERSTLYGLVIQPRKAVHYGPLDPEEARRILIRDGLVGGRLYPTPKVQRGSLPGPPFYRHNLDLVEALRTLENKSRRRDLLVDDGELVRFYDGILPADITTTKAFESWRRQAERHNPRLLFMDQDSLLAGSHPAFSAEQYPGHLLVAHHELALEYQFNPGQGNDGISVRIPLSLLGQLPEEPFQWLVPGLLENKVQALLKLLPQSLRRPLVPLPETVKRALVALDKEAGGLDQALALFLRREYGLLVTSDIWAPQRLPEHLRMNFRVEDDKGRILAQGRDLAALRETLNQQSVQQLSRLPREEYERDDVRSWDCGTLPERLEIPLNGRLVHAFPALVAEEPQRVALRLLDSQRAAREAGRSGLLRLFQRELSGITRRLVKELEPDVALRFAYGTFGDRTTVAGQLLSATVERLFMGKDGVEQIRSAEEFQRRLERGRPHLTAEVTRTRKLLGDLLRAHEQLEQTFKTPAAPGQREALDDMKRQKAALLFPGFLQQIPWGWLEHYPRYLKAMVTRLERAAQAPDKDRKRRSELEPLLRAQSELEDKLRGMDAARDDLEQLRWLLEELRVSLFAQELGTSQPVSVPRLERLVNDLRGLRRK